MPAPPRQKAFHPGKVPFPLMHVDTGFKFTEMYEFRDRIAREIGADLIVWRNEAADRRGRQPVRPRHAAVLRVPQDRGTATGLRHHQFDAAIGGARRDEEKSRAKERVFSFRDAFGQWDPRAQRPELWNLYNARVKPGESIRVFPLSNWTELDVWQYIHLEQIPVNPLYFARPRDAVVRGGQLIVLDGPSGRRAVRAAAGRADRADPRAGSAASAAFPARARFARRRRRVDEIVKEMTVARTSERGTRVIDHDSEGRWRRRSARDISTVRPPARQPRSSTSPPNTSSRTSCVSPPSVASTTASRRSSAASCTTRSRSTRTSSRPSGRTAPASAPGPAIEFALLTDGLRAEREQGITIDVAYRYFSTPKRHFIIADTPGHEQYTRNMVTGASTANLAIMLIDAAAWRPDPDQAPLLHRVAARDSAAPVAVNKMDLVDFSERVFDTIVAEYTEFATRLGVRTSSSSRSARSRRQRRGAQSADALVPRRVGPRDLERVYVASDRNLMDFRLPVQYVLRPSQAAAPCADRSPRASLKKRRGGPGPAVAHRGPRQVHREL